MEQEFIQLIEKARTYLFRNGFKSFSFENLNAAGISSEDIKKHVGSIEELAEAILEYERKSFEKIFLDYNFDGQNAIDILLLVSEEINDKFESVSPSFTMEFEKHFPEIYQKHMDDRMQFIFDKILINIQKGIAQGMYRDDLSEEMVGRMYLSKLENMHDPELYPPDRFKFGTIYDTMIDEFLKSIATEDGINYYKHRKQLLGVLGFGR